jgi:hypothetical protein
VQRVNAQAQRERAAALDPASVGKEQVDVDQEARMVSAAPASDAAPAAAQVGHRF